MRSGGPHPPGREAAGAAGACSRRRACRGLVSLGLLALGAAVVSAQRPPVETFTVDQGLPSAQILALSLDLDGRLWIASRGGVTVYDGQRFETFTVAEGLPHLRLQALASPHEKMATEARVFALTHESPQIYGLVGESWRAVSEPPRFGAANRGQAFLALHRPGPPTLLVGTSHSGVLVWTGDPAAHPLGRGVEGETSQGGGHGVGQVIPGHWSAIDLPANQPPGVTGLAELGGEVYIAGQHGLCRWPTGPRADCALRHASPRLAEPLVGLAVEPVASRTDGMGGDDPPRRLWIRGMDWIGWLEGDELHPLLESITVAAPGDAAGAVLAPGPHGGLYYGNRDRVHYLAPGQRTSRPLGLSEGLVAEGSTAILVDREENVWIGGLRGLSQIGPRRLVSFDSRQGLLANEVSAVLEWEPGEVLLGHNNGLSVLHGAYSDSRVESFPLDAPVDFDGVVGARVLDLARAGDGSLWMAAQRAGVLRWSPGHRPEVVQGIDPPCANAFSVERDGAGDLWVTCARRLLHCPADGGGCSETAVEIDSEGPSLLRRAVVAPDGTLHLATRQGLISRRPDGSWHKARGTTTESNNLYDVLDEGGGRVWVATAAGLYRRAGDPATGGQLVAVARPRIGRPSYGLLRDAMGRLWVATDDGVEIWDGATLRELSVRHGLAGREVNRGALVTGHGSRVWIGTDQGLSLYDPIFDHPRLPAPKVEIHGVEIDGLWRDLESWPVGSNDESQAAFQLAHHQNTLVFHLGAITLRRDDPILFRFRLEGFDEVWSPASVLPGGMVRYTHLPPGDYRFQLMAGRSGGSWSAAVVSPRFRIEPPWWRRWTVYFAGTTALILILVLAHGLRTRAIRRRNRRLEDLNRRLGESMDEVRKVAREREDLIAELEERNTELQRFLYSVSHDLKNQVVTIRGFAGHLVRDLEDHRHRRVLIDARRVLRAADTLGQLLEDLVDLSRVGRMVEPPEPVDLGELGREVEVAMAEAFADRRASLEIATDLPTVVVERRRFAQLFEILFDNALTFLGDQTKPWIVLGCRRAEEEMVVTVADHGIGIDPRYHERVFHLFERLDPEIPGTGVGLTLARRIVELHGGKIWIESRGKGHGTTVCFTVASTHRPGAGSVGQRGA